MVPIFVKIIQFSPYFRCLVNLILIFVKLHSIESFWQRVLKLLTTQWQRGIVWVTCQMLTVSEIELGKKLGFQAKLWPARNLCTIQLVILNSCLRGMSSHHSSSSSRHHKQTTLHKYFSSLLTWTWLTLQSRMTTSKCNLEAQSPISNRKSLSKRNFPSSRILIDEQEP